MSTPKLVINNGSFSLQNLDENAILALHRALTIGVTTDPVLLKAADELYAALRGSVAKINAQRKAAYRKAYSEAQAGGMNNTDCHEFATDQSERGVA